MQEDRPFLVCSSRIEEDFLKKKKTLRDTLGNSPAAAAPVSSPPGCPELPRGFRGIEPKSEALAGWDEYLWGWGWLRPQPPTRESMHYGRAPVCTPIAWRRVSA